ncbi:MAG: hypothetical protein NC120_05145 [Ruminococcus sp.]|nr:hypothetical protein [Ruminococcus sp.]
MTAAEAARIMMSVGGNTDETEELPLSNVQFYYYESTGSETLSYSDTNRPNPSYKSVKYEKNTLVEQYYKYRYWYDEANNYHYEYKYAYRHYLFVTENEDTPNERVKEIIDLDNGKVYSLEGW